MLTAIGYILDLCPSKRPARNSRSVGDSPQGLILAILVDEGGLTTLARSMLLERGPDYGACVFPGFRQSGGLVDARLVAFLSVKNENDFRERLTSARRGIEIWPA